MRYSCSQCVSSLTNSSECWTRPRLLQLLLLRHFLRGFPNVQHQAVSSYLVIMHWIRHCVGGSAWPSRLWKGYRRTKVQTYCKSFWSNVDVIWTFRHLGAL